MHNTPEIRIGYLNITDHLIMETTRYRHDRGQFVLKNAVLNAQLMVSFHQVLDALIENRIDGGFVPLPAALDLFGRGMEIRLLMFAHRSGSVMVQSRAVKKLSDFRGRSMLVPHFLSMQTMLSHKLFSAAGLRLGIGSDPETDVAVETVPPFLMPDMLANDREGDIGGYFVPEPFGTRSVMNDCGTILCPSDHLFKLHPCSVLVMADAFVSTYPEAVRELMEQLYESADILDRQDFDSLDDMLLNFFRLETDAILRFLADSSIRFTPSLLVPDPTVINIVQQYMSRNLNALPQTIDIDSMIARSFVAPAGLTDIRREN